ncbi:hypothetical protein AB0I30_14160 [Nocardia tengchongensis]|uniref:hypothetical protein n=1 Tax=Nocardia tengchongensis TaxID=2055889 RepID=UPI003400789B
MTIRTSPPLSARGARSMRGTGRAVCAGLAAVVFAVAALLFTAGPAAAAGGVSATATLDGRAIGGADAGNPVRLDPKKVSLVVVEVTNKSVNSVSIRRVDLAGHVLGLNFYSYSTTVELTVGAGKTEKLTYRLDPAGLDGQATGLIGSDLTLIGQDGKPLAAVHTVVDVRGSLASVYGLFGIIIAVLTGLAITDAALTVARHRLSANRWQRGLRLLAPGIGIGLMIGFTGSVARWWVPGTALWLALAGALATVFFLAGYFSPTPRQSDDLGLDPEDLAAAQELDARGFPAGSGAPPGIGAPVGIGAPRGSGAPFGGSAPYAGGGPNPFPGSPEPDPHAAPIGPNPPYGGTFRDLPPVGGPGGTYPDLDIRNQPSSAATEFVPYGPAGAGPAHQPAPGAPQGPMRVFPGGPAPGPNPTPNPADFQSGETTRISSPGFGGSYLGGGPLASAMQPDTGETRTSATDSPNSGGLPSGPVGTGPSPGRSGDTGAETLLPSGGVPSVSRPGGTTGPAGQDAADTGAATAGYPAGVQQPGGAGGSGETVAGRGRGPVWRGPGRDAGGRPAGQGAEADDEPTVRSDPGGQGFRSEGAGR